MVTLLKTNKNLLGHNIGDILFSFIIFISCVLLILSSQ